jgi:hypothetical protein
LTVQSEQETANGAAKLCNRVQPRATVSNREPMFDRHEHVTCATPAVLVVLFGDLSRGQQRLGAERDYLLALGDRELGGRARSRSLEKSPLPTGLAEPLANLGHRPIGAAHAGGDLSLGETRVRLQQDLGTTNDANGPSARPHQAFQLGANVVREVDNVFLHAVCQNA